MPSILHLQNPNDYSSLIRKDKIYLTIIKNITPREKEVLRLLSKDHTYRDVADRLFITVDTVKSHRRNLGSKLQVKTLGGLVRKGFELGLLDVAS